MRCIVGAYCQSDRATYSSAFGATYAAPDTSRLVLWMQAGLLLLVWLRCSFRGAYVRAGDVGADSSAHCRAHCTPHCATDIGTDCATDCHTDSISDS